MTYLPIELVLRVVKSLAPNHAIALSRSDSRTKAIWTFLFVSRGTYSVAIRLLYKHVLLVDSPEVLLRLINAIHNHTIRNMTMDSTLPRVHILDSLQNFCLAPYEDTIDDLPLAQRISELSANMRRTCTRLYLKLPIHLLPVKFDHLSVLPTLRVACEQFTAVKEAVIACENCWLPGPGNVASCPLWWNWENLHKLALLDIRMWRPVAQVLPLLPKLQVLLVMDLKYYVEPQWQLFLPLLHRKDLVIVYVSYQFLPVKSLKGWRDLKAGNPPKEGMESYSTRIEVRHLRDKVPGKFSTPQEWMDFHGVNGRLFDLEYLDGCGDFIDNGTITI